MATRKAPKPTLKNRWRRWRTYRNERAELKRKIKDTNHIIHHELPRRYGVQDRYDKIRGGKNWDKYLIAAEKYRPILEGHKNELKGLKEKHYGKK